MNWFSGGQSVGVTPGSMPNPEVKPESADGTVRGTHGRVGHCQKTILNNTRGRFSNLNLPLAVSPCLIKTFLPTRSARILICSIFL